MKRNNSLSDKASPDLKGNECLIDNAANDVLKYIKIKLSESVSTQGTCIKPLSDKVLERCLSISSFDSIICIPNHRSCGPESKDESKQRYCRNKAKAVGDFINRLLPSTGNNKIDVIR